MVYSPYYKSIIYYGALATNAVWLLTPKLSCLKQSFDFAHSITD